MQSLSWNTDILVYLYSITNCCKFNSLKQPLIHNLYRLTVQATHSKVYKVTIKVLIGLHSHLKAKLGRCLLPHLSCWQNSLTYSFGTRAVDSCCPSQLWVSSSSCRPLTAPSHRDMYPIKTIEFSATWSLSIQENSVQLLRFSLIKSGSPRMLKIY